MKVVLTFILFCLSTLFCFSQKVVLSFDYSKIAYVGMINDFEAMIENTNCRDLFLKTNNGKIYSYNSQCEFDFQPDTCGRSKVFFYKINKEDTILIDSLDIFVHLIKPDCFTPTLCGKTKGTIDKGMVRACGVVQVFPECFEIDIDYEIVSYNVLVVYKDKTSKQFENIGAKYSKQVEKEFANLKSGDIVNFTNIVIWNSPKIKQNITKTIKLEIE